MYTSRVRVGSSGRVVAQIAFSAALLRQSYGGCAGGAGVAGVADGACALRYRVRPPLLAAAAASPLLALALNELIKWQELK